MSLRSPAGGTRQIHCCSEKLNHCARRVRLTEQVRVRLLSDQIAISRLGHAGGPGEGSLVLKIEASRPTLANRSLPGYRLPVGPQARASSQ